MIKRTPFLAAPALAMAAALSLGACDSQSEAPQQGEAEQSADPAAQAGIMDESHAGEALPDFAITLPDGTEKKLAAFTGQPLLINLWATWCGPCKLEMPMLDQLAGERAESLKVLTVSQDMQGAEVVTPFFDEQGFSHLEPWIDSKNDLGFAYGGGVLPLTIYYDAEGKEVWRMIGEHDWTSAETAEMLAKAGT
ncbi:TlpA disulfide reductase family protein [Croceicoccus sp. Ery15]|uniref:TlpA family protein disulfide reductase n=1 Tax=Croceicoccus sp. Ery15 TaxID=1703338 RepID=UPI001E5863DF|nr:TlpA disulfide reductase family protein [Croceicoccus sp. Ery15]